jgi:hypothetical protein
VRQELIRRLCVNAAIFAVHGETARHAMRKCYVANLSALVGCDLFPRALSDLAVACAVACQTDHTDRRRYPRSGLPIPASIGIAFLVLPNSTRRFGITAK